MKIGDLIHTLRHDWQVFTEAERRAVLAALHPHLRARNVLDRDPAELTWGERLADSVTNVLGSWRFIVAQSAVLSCWIALNVIGWIRHWDPYPFILLNLALSFQAAYSGPVIMMSQNRQAATDRLVAANDYHVNLRAEVEVASIESRLNELAGRQWELLIDMQRRQIELLEAIHELARQQADQPAPGGG